MAKYADGLKEVGRAQYVLKESGRISLTGLMANFDKMTFSRCSIQLYIDFLNYVNRRRGNLAYE